MALKLIKQASVYKAVLPSAEAMVTHLQSLPFQDLTPGMAEGSGFVPVETHDEFVVAFPGGFAFALRYDEKVVPGSVVKAETKKRVLDWEEREGVKCGRKITRELQEIVVAELRAKAFVRTKIVTAFYHTAEQLLIVPTISRKLKDAFMGQLVRAVESIKTTTIHVSTAKGSLTNRLTDYMVSQDVDAFGTFNLGDKVILVSPAGKSTFDLDELTTAANGINEAISVGGQVSEIALSVTDGVEFRLTQDFLLKAIRFGETVESEESASTEPAAVFEHEAGVQVLQVVDVVRQLCQMFDYTPQIDSDDDDGDDLA